MVTIYVWPNGDWCFSDEVWKPDDGYTVHKVPDTWPDDRVDRYVQQLVKEQKAQS